MDVVEWKQSYFDQAVSSLGPYLKRLGFSEDRISYIPVSGFGGENLLKPVATEVAPWVMVSHCFFSLTRCVIMVLVLSWSLCT